MLVYSLNATSHVFVLSCSVLLLWGGEGAQICTGIHEGLSESCVMLMLWGTLCWYNFVFWVFFNQALSCICWSHWKYDMVYIKVVNTRVLLQLSWIREEGKCLLCAGPATCRKSLTLLGLN